jgi:hypothetical protein
MKRKRSLTFQLVVLPPLLSAFSCLLVFPFSLREGEGDSKPSRHLLHLYKCSNFAQSQLFMQQDVSATANKIRFLKLQVLETREGESADEALVRFQVWFKVVGQTRRDSKAEVQSMTELSKFVREDGVWKYMDAVDSEYEMLT